MERKIFRKDWVVGYFVYHREGLGERSRAQETDSLMLNDGDVGPFFSVWNGVKWHSTRDTGPRTVTDRIRSYPKSQVV